MTCAICGAECKLEEHEYFEGLCAESRPPGTGVARRWIVVAPLYYEATPGTLAMKRGFCSAGCAAKGLTEYATPST